MFPTGRCRNCGIPTPDILCISCINCRRCTPCYHYLRNDTDVCQACQNLTVHNIGCYILDWVIGDCMWYGTADHINVSKFVQSHSDDIIATLESATNANVIIKYYFELVVDFFWSSQDGNVLNTSAHLYLPPTTLDVDNLDLANILRSLS